MRHAISPLSARPWAALLAVVAASLGCSQQQEPGECLAAARSEITVVNNTDAPWSVSFRAGEETFDHAVDGLPAQETGVLPPEGSALLTWGASTLVPWSQQFALSDPGTIAFYGNGGQVTCPSTVDDTVVEDLDVCFQAPPLPAASPLQLLSAIQCVPAEDGSGNTYVGTVSVQPAYPNVDTRDWMRQLNPDWRLGDLTIPGTHDSASWNTSTPYAKTQALNFTKQMEWGIRAFDLRLNENMMFFHGTVYLNQALRDFLRAAGRFLEEHPDEFLIAFVKPENCKKIANYDYSAQFLRNVNDHGMDDIVLRDKAVMSRSVRELRRKIVVITRQTTAGDCGWIENAPEIRWPVGTNPHTDSGPGGKGTDWLVAGITDEYDLGPVKKMERMLQHLQDAAGDSSRQLWIGFLSGYKSGKGVIPCGPYEYARAIQPPLWGAIVGRSARFKLTMCDWGKEVKRSVPGSRRKLGVLLMDFVGNGSNDQDIRDNLIDRNWRDR